MYNISVPSDTEYYPAFTQFFQQAFPASQSTDSTAVFEAVVAELLGTKKMRYGPKPKPEQQVKIRAIVRTAMDAGAPIPILAPWGSRKQGTYELDLAEMVGIKTLVCLRNRVQRLYAPGVKVRIRLEDLTDSWLFRQGDPAQIQQYTAKMIAMTGIMADDFVEVVPESSIMDECRHAEIAAYAQERFDAYLTGMSPIKVLQDMGWQGEIPQEQRDYYYRAYARFYPDAKPEAKLAEYFASTYARVSLHGSGNTDTHADPIQLSLSLPVPGSPMQNARIYYRTLPTCFTTKHKSPWNARGYFEIQEDGTARPKLAGWDDALEFQECDVTIGDAEKSVTVRADYVV